MAIVTGVQFDHIPSRLTRFPGKRFEEGSRGVSVNACDVGGGEAGLPIEQKLKRFFETMQTEITEP